MGLMCTPWLMWSMSRIAVTCRRSVGPHYRGLVTQTTGSARGGRPPKTDAAGVETPERLLRHAVEAFAEFGYEGVTLAEIARRAGVSTPAIYNHFTSKDELVIEASRAALRGFNPPASDAELQNMDIAHSVARFASPDAAALRRMLAELHLASTRNDDIRPILSAWHLERFQPLEANGYNPAKVKASYVLLLGLSMLESLQDIDVDHDDLMHEVAKMGAALEPLTE